MFARLAACWGLALLAALPSFAPGIYYALRVAKGRSVGSDLRPAQVLKSWRGQKNRDRDTHIASVVGAPPCMEEGAAPEASLLAQHVEFFKQ